MASMKCRPASRPPLSSKLKIAPEPLGNSFLASSWSGWPGSSGYATHSTAPWASRNSTIVRVFATWRSMRTDKVSTPWRMWKALVGLKHAPKSRSPSVRARITNAGGPNSST